MSSINFPKGEYLRMLTHAFHELPYEACGILTLEDERLIANPCKNDDPGLGTFTICVVDHERILNSGHPIMGTYHSHPGGLAQLSAGDVDMLPVDQIHFVIGMREKLCIRAWRLRASGRHYEDEQVSKVIRRVSVYVSDDPYRALAPGNREG